MLLLECTELRSTDHLIIIIIKRIIINTIDKNGYNQDCQIVLINRNFLSFKSLSELIIFQLTEFTRILKFFFESKYFSFLISFPL